MIKFSTAILIVVASLVSGPVFAACAYPAAVSVPNGAEASETEMMRAKQSVTAYIAQVEAYLKCIDAEPLTETSAPPDLQSEKTSARESMRRLADSYNAEVLAFKAVNE
ncbi:MAG: hypothetical protein ACR2QB_06885 [Gammaproteobacteria bacterium]